MNEEKFLQAREIINNYKLLRLDKEAKNLFDLQGKLENINYTEEEFLNDENEYYIKNSTLNIKTINESTLLQETQTGVLAEDDTLLFVTPTKSHVYNGNLAFNREYCDTNNVEVFDLGYNGGTIVTTNKDVAILYISKNKSLLRFIQKEVHKIIKLHVDRSIMSGNDILIDGYKISGCAKKEVGNKYLYYFQFSFEVDLPLIEAITTKIIEKVPKGLKEFVNIDREVLINDIKNLITTIKE